MLYLILIIIAVSLTTCGGVYENLRHVIFNIPQTISYSIPTCLTLINCTNIKIYGTGTIRDTNFPSTSYAFSFSSSNNITIKDISIYGRSITSSSSNIHEITISNVKFYNGPQNSMDIKNASIIMKNCRTNNYHVDLSSTVTNAIIHNNYFSGTGNF